MAGNQQALDHFGYLADGALEVREACETLHGRGPADTRELTLELAAEMIRLAGGAPDGKTAREAAVAALDSGRAWEKFLAMVEAQGGDARLLETPERLHPAPIVSMVPSPADGFVTGCDCFAVGELVVALGGGRRAKEDDIDPRVGLVVLKRPGDPVRAGEPLAELHLGAPGSEWVERAASCFRVGGEATPAGPLVLERID